MWAYRYWSILCVLEQTNRIRAVFGAGFAVLLGVGIAAVVQTFVWENSVTLVARTYEMLNRIDGIAYFSQAVESSALRYASTSDTSAAAECRRNLTDMRSLLAAVGSLSTEGPSLQNAKTHVAELTDEEYFSIRSVLDTGSPAKLMEVMAARNMSGARAQEQTAILGLSSQLRQVLDERMVYQAATASRARRLFLTSGVICCVLIVVAGWQFSLDLGRREIFGKARALRHEHYRQVVELAADMIFRLDEQGRFTYCNQAALQLLHYGEQEVIGRSFTKLVRLDMRREVGHFYMRQMARSRKTSYYEFAIVDGHGRERWIGQNVQLLADGNQLTGFQAIARDITERKRLEADLARRHSFLEGIASTTPGLYYVFDLVERRNVFENRELASVLGYQPEEERRFRSDRDEIISSRRSLGSAAPS